MNNTSKEGSFMKKSITKILIGAMLISLMTGITAQAGWQEDTNGKKYQYASTAYARDGVQEIEGSRYLFDQSGYMVTGWQMCAGKWYYADPQTGIVCEGWLQESGHWYYLEPGDGCMRTGWLFLGDKRYYLNKKTGELVMGTFTGDNDSNYYYETDETGAVVNAYYATRD